MSTYSTTNINVSSQLIVGATSSLQLTNLNSNKIINVATGSNALDAVNTGQLASATASTYTYVNLQIASATASINLTEILSVGNSVGANQINMNSNKIINVATGSSVLDAVNVGQLTAATASLIILTNTGITNSIPYFDTTNSLTSSSNLQFQTFDAANSGRGIYINSTSANNFILGNYNVSPGTTILNAPQNVNGSKIAFRFQNGADIFDITNISSLYYVLSNTTGFRIGDTITPTARLHITNGGQSANTSPLKLTGTGSNLLTTPENGAIEFNGTNLFYTGTYSGTQNRVKILGQTGSNTANGIAYFSDANQVKTSTNFTYNGTDLNIGASGNYIRVGGAAMIGASTTTGTNLYPVSINQITFGDQTNGNPNVINMYLNSISSFGMSIGTNGITASARLELRGASQSRMAPLKISATSSINLLTTTEAGAIESDANHLYFTATASGTRYQLDRQGVSNYSHTIFAPTTGQTVNLINNQYNIINPLGALLALTLNLPSSPNNNDCVYIKFTQNVTTVTYANGTVVDGITAPSAGGLTVLVYDSGTTSWY